MLAALRTRTSSPLFSGEGDEGHRFVFSPSARVGFWTYSRGAIRGKGRLLPAGIDALTEIAREKGLLPRPRD